MLLWWWWCDVSILLEHWGSSCDSTPSGSGEPARSTPERGIGCSGSAHLEENIYEVYWNLSTAPLTCIQQQDELEADIVRLVEAQLLHGGRHLQELLRHAGHSQQGQAQQLKLLTVGQLSLVREVVVHPAISVSLVGPGLGGDCLSPVMNVIKY